MSFESIRTELCGGNAVTSVEIDEELRGYINDALEPGETSLISDEEIGKYLPGPDDVRMRTLEKLAMLNLSGCSEMKAPLFSILYQGWFASMGKVGLMQDYGLFYRSWAGARVGTPDREFVDALMLNLRYSTTLPHPYSDASVTTLSGFIYSDYEDFVPPSRLLANGEPSESARRAWVMAGRVLLQRAWLRTFTKECLEDLRARYPYITKLITEANTEYPQLRMFFYYDVEKKSDAQAVEDVGRFVDEVRTKFRAELERVMADPRIVDAAYKIAAVTNALTIAITFKQEIQYIDYLRGMIETDGDRAAFLNILRQAIRLANPHYNNDFDDLDVGLLTSEDAVMGYGGVYVPSSDPMVHSAVRVPMSNYGTLQQLPFLEVLKTLAHEMAHHRVRKNWERQQKTGVIREHDLNHALVAQNILRWLISFTYDFEDGGRVSSQ